MELSFCVVIPIIASITHIIYQGNRYFIFAGSGCIYSLDQSWVSLVLGYMWPLVVCFIASYYCGTFLILHHQTVTNITRPCHLSPSSLPQSVQ
jgi:pheromone a factor receptor